MRKLSAVVAVVAVIGLAGCARTDFETGSDTGVDCRITNLQVLSAQSVPTASFVPCIETSDEFTLTHQNVGSSGSLYSFALARADGVWNVQLRSACDLDDATEVSTTPGGVTHYRGGDGTTTYQVFAGGCVESSFDVSGDADGSWVAAAQESLHLIPRSAIAAQVDDRTDGELPLDPSR